MKKKYGIYFSVVFYSAKHVFLKQNHLGKKIWGCHNANETQQNLPADNIL